MHRKLVFLLLLALLVPLVAVPAAAGVAAEPSAQAGANDYRLHVSFEANRGRSATVESLGVLSGRAHIFVTPPAGVDRVRFFIDPSDEALQDPTVAGDPYFVADRPPFDLGGADEGGRARGFDTTRLPNGPHTIVAALDLSDGRTLVHVVQVVIHNGPRALYFGPETAKFTVLPGSRGSKAIRLLTSDFAPARYTLSTDADWVSFDAEHPVADGRKGSAPSFHTVEVDSTGMAPGTYTATITATGEDAAATSTTVTMEVTAAAACSPLPCSEILVQAPYVLNFSQNHGKITDKAGVGTGFTTIEQPVNGTGYIPANLQMDMTGPGTLNITTTKGIMFGTSNSQDNALAVGVDAPDQISLLDATLLNPPAGTGNYEQAGLWFGNDDDNYVKLEVISEPGATRIEYLYELAGVRTASSVTGPLLLSSSTVGLRLRANPADRVITAYYSINGGDATQLGQFVVPGEFFSFDAAGIDPEIGTRSFGGIFATQRNSNTPLVYKFDNFSVTAEAPPPPSTETSFTRSSFALTNPTSMVWGPDNKLYVLSMFGTIHQITLNDAKQVVSDVTYNPLGSRLSLGITVDPASTATNVILWVAHSSPSVDAGELNSSMVTKLSGANFATRQDVIAGLPRAIANHAINSIHFGPDGKLYIALGGNTGAGAPNTANTEFGTRAEQPLSAAFLVADVKAAGFDGTCATPEGQFAPSPCSVTPYSTGLRNMYDFVWHSNGFAYGPDNGLGVTGTYPPSPTAPCTGFGNTASYTQGGNNPGAQPDIFVRLQQGKYYGHPNPYRNECVFKDGSYQGVPPLSNFVQPIYNLGMNRSTNGTIEYKSNAFNGSLKGEVLVTNYSVGDDITRLRLAADGLSVVSAKQLVGGFNDPLPLVEGPDGTIYVGELGGQKITVLVPQGGSTAPTPTPGPSATPTTAPPGTWTTKTSLPVALLDAGGTEMNGKLYVVGGKTTGDVHQKTLYIYDPATNAWAQGPSLPDAYVPIENPAAVSYQGKLYVFGGSTAAFSGAVTSAARFDPAANAWTMLAPMQVGRGGPTAQVLNGKVYVIGGMDTNGSSLSSVEVYDIATNSWNSAAPMLTRRDNPGSAVLNGRLYVFGGRTRNSSGVEENGTLNTVEVYDAVAETWSPRAPMPTGRRTMAVGLLNGKAQLMGGERTSTGGTFPHNEEYDPQTDSWRTLAPMQTGRHGMAAATINGIVYTAGGGPNGGSSFSSINEAFSLGTSAVTPTPTVPAATATTAPPATATPTPTPTVVAPTATPVAPTATVPAPSPTAAPTATPAPNADTIKITRAEYRSGRSELLVDATSTGQGATLSVYVTSSGQFIGTLQVRGGFYSNRFALAANPVSVTVRSSLGGTASSPVTAR